MIPDCDLSRAVDIAETLRKTVEKHDFTGVLGKLTISIGVVTATGKEERMHLFKTVDDCLYFAKQNGRNQVSSLGS